MATIKIFHDEKENAITKTGADAKQTNLVGKDKRPTLALLSNVANHARTFQGGKAVLADTKLSSNQHNVFKQHQKSAAITNDNYMKAGINNTLDGEVCIQNKKTTVTNTIHQTQQHRQWSSSTTTTTTVSVEQFTVYEDKLSSTDKENLDISANKSDGAIRDPLKDITKHEIEIGSETPMSVSDILSSPMSVDKTSVSQILDVCGDDSVITVGDESKTEEQLSKLLKKPKNDRERFFEIEEYQHDILHYFRDVEKRSRPKASYMKRQPDINYSMRTILVDWLVEVAEEYKMETETLFLAISYVDRFLSCMSVVRAKLQLLGTAAMFVAAKYEEIYPPDVGEFVFITDDTYTKTQLLRMEKILLNILGFDLSGPTCYVYLNTYAVLYSMSDKVKFLATYLCELSLLEGDPYLKFLPSQISSAAVALARYTLQLPMWDKELQKITSYNIMDLKEIILSLSNSYISSKTIKQQAIQEKYRLPKYLEVSKIDPVDINADNIDEILLEELNSFEAK